jgi:hypothetical protein
MRQKATKNDLFKFSRKDLGVSVGSILWLGSELRGTFCHRELAYILIRICKGEWL